MARRAARILSTAVPRSRSGRSASPLESSMDRPATPVPTASRTLSAMPALSVAKPPSKSALIGTSVAATMAARCSSMASRQTPLSARPCDQAKPALVVASARKPRLCRYSALPRSQGFGIRKQPDSCSWRNRRRLSVTLGRVLDMPEAPRKPSAAHMLRHLPRLGQRAPDRRQPRLLVTRETGGAVVMLQLHEPRFRNMATPGVEIVKGAVAAAVPPLLVVAVRVGAEQRTPGLQRGLQVAQHAR